MINNVGNLSNNIFEFSGFEFLQLVNLKIFDCITYFEDEYLLQIFGSNDNLFEIVEFLQLDEVVNAQQLLDIFASPSIYLTGRIDLNYILLSNNERTWVKVLAELQNFSIADLYSSSIWLEREVWDLYGIFFIANPDLRRILTDYGFEGYPLRKDFPTSGYYEIRYDESKKLIISEPVEFTQESRVFNFTSPWEEKI